MIAYDARSIYEHGTGDRVYFTNVIRQIGRLMPDAELALYYHLPDRHRDEQIAFGPNIRLVETPGKSGVLWPHVELVRRLKADRATLLHAQYTLPLKAPCPTVVTIHDVSFRVNASWFPRKNHAIMNVLIPQAARSATRILTVSEFSKRELCEKLQVDPARVTVTPDAVSERFAPVDSAAAREFVRTNYGLDGPYFIGVGLQGSARQYERKNAALLFRALDSLKSRGRWPAPATIVLTGAPEQFGPGAAPAWAGQARFVGFVPDEHLPFLYNAARACVYPSRYEGFGLPPLEAMSCGCPVIASNCTAIPEVVGDCGILLDPDDADAWAQALARALDEDLRGAYGQKALLRARAFSWEQTARQTIEVYRKIAPV